MSGGGGRGGGGGLSTRLGRLERKAARGRALRDDPIDRMTDEELARGISLLRRDLGLDEGAPPLTEAEQAELDAIVLLVAGPNGERVLGDAAAVADGAAE
jgi:hypothetical protein